MKAYKIISAFGTSCLALGIFERKYAIGQVTTPPDEFPEAYLMAFKYLASAKAFGDGRIFLAEVELADGPEMISEGASEHRLIEFWSGEGVDTMPAPPGTIFCKSIELIRDVTYEDI